MCVILSLGSHASSASNAGALLPFLHSLSYYYFAWGHSILVTLPAGNVSRLDSRAKKVGYSVSFAASRFSFVVLASSFTVLELQTWAAGLRFLSEQVLRLIIKIREVRL
jgi:hypothetical protein